MVKQSVVISKNHIDIWGRVIRYCNNRINFIKDFYSENFANTVVRLDLEISKVEKRICNERQIIMSFELDSLATFKEMIYMFMRDEFKRLTKEDIEVITNILDRCDTWVEEYMNTNGDGQVYSCRFDNDSMKWDML